MAALEFLLLVLAFASTLLGTLGPARREEKVGFNALTGWGWAALVLSFISLLAAGVLAGIRVRALNEQARENARVRTVAVLQFQRELDRLISPLEAVITAQTGQRSIYPCQDHFDMGLHRFKESAFRGYLETTRLSALLPQNLGRPSTTWAAYFDEVRDAALSEISRLVATYSGHIDSQTIVLIELLTEDLRGLDAKRVAQRHPEASLRRLFSFVGGLEESNTSSGWLSRLEEVSSHLREQYDYSAQGVELAYHITGKSCLGSGDSR